MTILTSPDTVTWTRRLNPWDLALNGQHICWSADLGLFVIPGYVGSDLATLLSSDGLSWAQHVSSVMPSVSLASIAAGSATKKLIVGDGSGDGFSSADGSTWSALALGASYAYEAAWDGSYWITTGGSGCQRSPDGVTWTNLAPNAPGGFHIASDGSGTVLEIGQLASGGGSDDSHLTTDHGTTWANHSASVQPIDLIWWPSAGLWVILDEDASISFVRVWTSPDGITWTSHGVVAGAPGNLAAVSLATDGTTLVIVGYDFVADWEPRFWTSPDAVTWTTIAPTGFDGCQLLDATYSPALGLWAAIGGPTTVPPPTAAGWSIGRLRVA